MQSRKSLARLLLLLALFGPAPVAAAEQEAGLAAVSAVGPPSEDAGAAVRAVVESLHEVLLGCMKQADEFGFQGRYDRIAAKLDEAFDLTFMARMAVGSAWKELAEQERSEFVDLSRRYSASKYAYNFNGYGGERFETHLHEPAARGTMVVKTTLVQPKDDDVQFDYRLRHADGHWRIIDIQLDGRISELAYRRAQYRSLIRREGFPHLVETLEEKIDELSRE